MRSDFITDNMSIPTDIEQLEKDILSIQGQIREAYTIPCLTLRGICLSYLNVLKSRALVRLAILKREQEK